jgi:NTE family protein
MNAAGALAQRPGTDPTFAVAFGGGGARGLAHIHAIQAFDELGIRPVAIAGSSIGAIMGAGMASGMSGDEIHHYAKSILGRRGEVASRIWKSRPGSLREAVAGGFRLGQFDIPRILKAFLPEAVPETFEALAVPLQVTGTDFYGHGMAVFDSGDLLSALAASAAIPALFRPVTRDGRLFIDGGIYNPVPFDLLVGKADILVAIDVVGAPDGDPEKAPSAIDLMFGASQLMMQSIIEMKLSRQRPDIFLRPPVSRFRVLDFLKIDSVLADTAALKDDLKRAIDAAVSARAAVSASM